MINKNFILRFKKSIRFRLNFSLSTFYFLFFTIVFSTSSFAQNKKQLEAKRKTLQKEIKQINRLLSKTKKNEKTLLIQLDDINKKIDVHQKIINTINSESDAYSKEIKENKTEILLIEKQLKLLKEDYSKTVVQSYKSKNKNSRLLFLLSSTDFLQAYKRMQYMKQYADFRKKQATDIGDKKQILLQLNDSILLKKQVKDSLVSQRIKERKIVDTEKAAKQKVINKVKQKERKYLAQIRKKQKQEQQFENKLEKLILGVITKSNKKSGKKSKKFVLTPEAKKLAANFISNKGKLPAPVEKGYVSRYFGERKHEILKKIKIKSNGWYYTTAKNTKARAVFKGVVKAIMVDKKTKIKTVLIQHGNYMTVYSNLEKLLVKEGDKIKTKQKLGTIHTDATTGKTILKFALWKDAKAQNPSDWMHK